MSEKKVILEAPGCRCTLAKSLTGGGCRHCQPQTMIDTYSDIIKDMEEERDEVFYLLKIVMDRGADYDPFHKALNRLAELTKAEVGDD